ncbi:MAG: DUF2975 domain-containing protein [Maricaulaceae bacterium]|nr:DUF2975 domain-containing protein [Maricaulaceae bacterium]
MGAAKSAAGGASPADKIARHGGVLAAAGGLAAALLVLKIMADAVAAVAAIYATEGAGAAEYANAAGLSLIANLGFIITAFGLQSMIRLGQGYRKGEVFTAAAAGHMAAFGSSLLLAASAIVLISPNLIAWIGGEANGYTLRVSSEALLLAVAGVFVTTTALIMGEAARLKAENDSFI